MNGAVFQPAMNSSPYLTRMQAYTTQPGLFSLPVERPPADEMGIFRFTARTDSFSFEYDDTGIVGSTSRESFLTEPSSCGVLHMTDNYQCASGC